MKFKNDNQRRAAFANINKFSLFDRFRSDDYFVDKRNELVYKINARRENYSDKDISKMTDKLGRLNAKIRGREKRETYEEGHGPIRRIVDSAVDIVHEPKPVYSARVIQEPVYDDVVVEYEYPIEYYVESSPIKKSFGDSFADAIVGLYPD